MDEKVFEAFMGELTEWLATLDQERLGVAIHRLIIGLAAEVSNEGAYKILRFLEEELKPSPIIVLGPKN